MTENAYEILGVAKDASERDVRRAYRALLFDLEDKGQSDPEFPEKKKRLEDAFAKCLADAQTRGAIAPEASAKKAEVNADAVRNKLAVRVLFGVVAIVAIVACLMLFKDRAVDPEGETPTDTVGMIAALESVGGSTKAVIIRPDGTKVVSPGYKDGVVDRDIAWRPDGARLLFISNRFNGNFDVVRWDPKADKTEIRSQGNRAKSSLWFGWESSGVLRDQALMTSGGFVMKYNQKTTLPEQILPPPNIKSEGSDEEGGGSVSQMDAIYKQIGEAFMSAKWGIDRQVVWTVMRRETDSVFVMNPLTKAFNKGIPMIQFAGKAIEFDVTPAGDAVAAVREYQFVDPTKVPENFLIDGKPVLPFGSAIYFCPADGKQPAIVCHTKGSDLFIGGTGQQPKPVFSEPKATLTVAQPIVSADGATLVFVLGRLVGEKGFEGLSLIAFPLRDNGPLKQPGRVALGAVSDPCFSGDGTKITYLKLENGKHAIYTANVTGGTENKVSDDGDYVSPKFSPQLPLTSTASSASKS